MTDNIRELPFLDLDSRDWPDDTNELIHVFKIRDMEQEFTNGAGFSKGYEIGLYVNKAINNFNKHCTIPKISTHDNYQNLFALGVLFAINVPVIPANLLLGINSQLEDIYSKFNAARLEANRTAVNIARQVQKYHLRDECNCQACKAARQKIIDDYKKEKGE